MEGLRRRGKRTTSNEQPVTNIEIYLTYRGIATNFNILISLSTLKTKGEHYETCERLS